MNDYELIEFTVTDHIATVTLNRQIKEMPSATACAWS